MVRTKTQTDFGTWHVPGRSPLIEYSNSLLGFLASSAKSEAGAAQPVAGVLFGNTDGSEIRITAHRSVDCSATADEFPLTAKGEDQIQMLVDNYSAEPDLRGLVPVGWYRSRGHSNIQLSTEDLRVWNRYFPLPWQVTLVLKRHEDATVKAGFFFRPDRGPVRTESSYRTFEVEPAEGVSPDMSRLAAAVASPPPPPPTATPAARPVVNNTAGAAAAAALAPVPGAVPRADANLTEATPPAELFVTPQADDEGARARSRKITIAVGVFSFAAASWMFATTPRAMENPVQDVALHFQGSPADLRVAWNPEAGAVRGARSARLEIIDGEKRSSVNIAADALRRGAWPVSNVSGAVEAHLIVETANAEAGAPRRAEAISQYVGSPGGGETALVSALERIRWIREQLSRSEKAPAAAVQPLAMTAPAPPPFTSASVPPQQQQQQPARPIAAPQQSAIEAAVPQPPAPPAQQQPQQPPAAAPAFSDPVPARTTAVLPPPAPPSSPVYAGPSAGKLIWTGYLPGGSVLNIDGRNASSGTVNGSLPGVPVRVSVYPAEFSSGGLSVYSGNPRHQSGAVVEARSAQNGWLNTRYVYDPSRARDVAVTGAPNAGGNFRQLQVRGGERPLSVVVIEWEVAK